MKNILIRELLVIVSSIITCVNTHNETFSMSDASNTSVQCGNSHKLADECFKDLPPHLMQFLQTPKITISEKEIASKCNVFKRGMRCFDEYTARCLPDANLNLFKHNVEGARNFFIKFCGNREFQRDYLKHKDCFTHIQEDWVRCTEIFKNILTGELHQRNSNVNNKFMEFCCARNAYENCIYNSARFKCYQHSAIFARDTAKMLSEEKHFSNCQQYENALCNSEAALIIRFKKCWLVLLLMLVFQFVWKSLSSTTYQFESVKDYELVFL